MRHRAMNARVSDGFSFEARWPESRLLGKNITIAVRLGEKHSSSSRDDSEPGELECLDPWVAREGANKNETETTSGRFL